MKTLWGVRGKKQCEGALKQRPNADRKQGKTIKTSGGGFVQKTKYSKVKVTPEGRPRANRKGSKRKGGTSGPRRTGKSEKLEEKGDSRAGKGGFHGEKQNKWRIAAAATHRISVPNTAHRTRSPPGSHLTTEKRAVPVGEWGAPKRRPPCSISGGGGEDFRDGMFHQGMKREMELGSGGA